MTATNSSNFKDLRLRAAKMFAQSMVFVDDEASQRVESQPVSPLERPEEGINAKKVPDVQDEQDKGNNIEGYTFDAKSLIDRSMELGLICSVLRPEKGEDFKGRVVTAASVADIVCLDWEIYDDGGEAASQIIASILQEDSKQNGRLRLIAIYTGDVTNKNIIMDQVYEAIPAEIKEKQELNKEAFEIKSKSGVQIVCLFKKHGVRLEATVEAHQVSEAELPQRLQSEFSKLSEGLLSNTALATIASIRNSTHHVLSKFAGQMDGPFFHHRALIDNPEDAEEYAVNIILSELKGAVDKQQIGTDHTGSQAISSRIQELAENLGDAETLKFHYGNRENPETYDLDVKHAIRMASGGLHLLSDFKNELRNPPPRDSDFKNNFSSLFAGSLEKARSHMHQFAALTGVQTYPGSYLCQQGTWFPKLGLGSIVREDENESYLLCLQASCDSVRIKGEKYFLFVSLEEEEADPDHVIPMQRDNTEGFDCIGLKISSESYRATCTIRFTASQETKTVNAKNNAHEPDFYFEDTEGKKYLWVADLKRRRALRTAQNLG
ncbi:MAG: response regulator receiver domain [Gammaproteobacteria bacterium]|nr:response regulator receiver domain [Gammaproteobacteria bacterium]